MMIETARLILRAFQDADIPEFQRIYADPVVMEHMNGPKTPDVARISVERKAAKWQSQGYGFWCVEDKASGTAIGHCGLDFLDPLGEVECGYLLDRPFWGRGLATEMVRATLEWGFSQKNFETIIAIARPENIASMRVMENAGMTRRGEVIVWERTFFRYAINRDGANVGGMGLAAGCPA
ncbi:GNAT family N-acetyltransferase [Magnetospirillum sp. SS-4]|uniref:GNAT family N-acetyltransferase n=1 Tax=Magnetospirillum sp. SS-4 TaxID=2681465 RepID=UPI001383D4A5|nr:GNAT family N-acetyltransferase [Magnetospirillum sp. SS-4]CAA7614488.1 GCN5-related N-acetyltransferase [Magnetospirillum sp. SS-4]